jgi:hypothetical protein
MQILAQLQAQRQAQTGSVPATQNDPLARILQATGYTNTMDFISTIAGAPEGGMLGLTLPNMDALAQQYQNLFANFRGLGSIYAGAVNARFLDPGHLVSGAVTFLDPQGQQEIIRQAQASATR